MLQNLNKIESSKVRNSSKLPVIRNFWIIENATYFYEILKYVVKAYFSDSTFT